MAKQQPKQSLRTIGKQLGILGAEETPAFKFMSQAPTDLRNEAVAAGIEPNQNISLDDTELQRQIAEQLRTSGPATFRNLRDVIGTTGIKSLQEQFGLTNIPQNILSSQEISKPGETIAITGPEGQTLSGVRKTLAESLKPETMQQTVRRSVINKSKKDALKDEINTQLLEAEATKAQGPKQPNFLDRLAGVGNSFLDKLFSPKESPSQPITSVTVPETGETINFEDNQISQLEQEYQAALTLAGNDPKKVARINQRFAELMNQLSSQGGKQ